MKQALKDDKNETGFKAFQIWILENINEKITNGNNKILAAIQDLKDKEETFFSKKFKKYLEDECEQLNIRFDEMFVVLIRVETKIDRLEIGQNLIIEDIKKILTKEVSNIFPKEQTMQKIDGISGKITANIDVVYEIKNNPSLDDYSFKIIDQTYFESIINLHFETPKIYNGENFYLYTNNDEIQWWGHLNDFVAPREIQTKVLEHILDGLNHTEVPILAWIEGSGGMGKSTMLKSLACEMISLGYTVAWFDASISKFSEIERLN